MKRKLWTVGLFSDGEVVVFGPFSKETAEALFKKLNDETPTGSQPFIQPLQKWGSKCKSWLPDSLQ